MKNLLFIVSTISLITSGIYANESMLSTDMQNTQTQISENKMISSYGFGISQITLGDTTHEALIFTSKIGYTNDNNVSMYLLTESNYYKHLGDINDMGILGLGIGYAIPYTQNTVFVEGVVGMGINLNYNQMFKAFDQSYDFGFAYRATIGYQINEKWKADLSYSKFDFNTNSTKLEALNPEMIGISVSYDFNTVSWWL